MALDQRGLVAGCRGVSRAGLVNWNVRGNGDSNDSLTNAANWTGGFPANGSNVFMVWTRGAAGPATKMVTDAANQFFIAELTKSVEEKQCSFSVFTPVLARGLSTCGLGLQSGSGEVLRAPNKTILG